MITVDESTRVAIEEESTSEKGVAAAAAPDPNKVRGGRETAFSFSLAGANNGGYLTMSWERLSRNQNRRQGHPTMDVIGFIGTLLGASILPQL